MTTETENAFLTSIGPGTPTGALRRQYRIPTCLSAELAADGDPLRLVLLGERPLTCRDSVGKISIFDHRCPSMPRYPSAATRRVGCAYHRGKFDTEGNFLDTPDVPGAHDVAQHVKARAYKAAKRNGVIWSARRRRRWSPF